MKKSSLLEQLIEKNKGEMTYYDHEPLGVFFTMGHLENFYNEIIELSLTNQIKKD
jgi:hypothetical protein